MTALGSPAGFGADTRRQIGLRSEGSSTSHTFGTEPLWKYGAVAHTPYSGGARYPLGSTVPKHLPGVSVVPYPHQVHFKFCWSPSLSERSRAGSVSIVDSGTTCAAIPSSFGLSMHLESCTRRGD